MENKKPASEHNYYTLFLLNKPLRVANGMPTSLFIGGLSLAIVMAVASGTFYVGLGVVFIVSAINGVLGKEHTKNKIPDFTRALILKSKSPNYVFDNGKTYKKLIDGSN